MSNPFIQGEYWLHIQFGLGKIKWHTLQFNGVLFPPLYKPHNIPIIYKGKKIHLDSTSEEIATIYAKYTDTDYIKNRVFRKNFWKDWKKILGKDNIIQSLDDCDFSLIYNYLLDKKEKKKLLDKDKIKQEKQKLEDKYRYAIVDGIQQPIGNFRMEPPGIFIGRGCHPKLGKIKKRITPEDVTLNLSKNAIVPRPFSIEEDGDNFILKELVGSNWKTIINDNRVEWLASWKDDITGKTKYVWFGDKSEFKAKSDMHKFDMARKLKRKIKTIRIANEQNLISSDIKIKQLATALYFIDHFALRVGNEKREDEADTVGVASLRVEHMELLEDDKIKLDFLSKDSIRYINIVKVDNVVYNNIKEFINKKQPTDELFNLINSNDINKYLQEFMPDLTAKVFRTYNASTLFQNELDKITKKYSDLDIEDKINILLDEFNKANAKVAILCNHQKSVSKNFSEQLDKMTKQIKELRKKKNKWKSSSSKMKKERISKIDDKINKLKMKKQLKIELKDISLGTSKTNYIDPRITISFMKKFNLPIDKIFTKALQEKFFWAFDIDSHFTY